MPATSLCIYTVDEDCEGLLSIFPKLGTIPNFVAVSLSRFALLSVRIAYPPGFII
jgi:hypothetical protein